MKSDLEMRVARLLGADLLSGPRNVGQAQTPAREPLVSFRMWCSATGKPFSVIARREGNTLYVLRNEVQGSTGISGATPPPLTSFGKCRFEDDGWPGCPHCGAKSNSRKNLFLLWSCEKEGCGFPLHCVGERGGLFRCACGIAADREFQSVPVLEVRGSRTACNSTPKATSISNPNTNTAVARSHAPSLPGANPQLTYKGK